MKYIKSLATQTCVTFTLLTLFLFILASAIGGSEFTAAIDLPQLLIILASSAVIGAANQIFKIKQIPFWGKLFIHYGILAIVFICVFVGIGKIASEAGGVFIMVFFFTVVYAVVCSLVFALLGIDVKRRERKKEEKKEYENIYSNKS